MPPKKIIAQHKRTTPHKCCPFCMCIFSALIDKIAQISISVGFKTDKIGKINRFVGLRIDKIVEIGSFVG